MDKLTDLMLKPRLSGMKIPGVCLAVLFLLHLTASHIFCSPANLGFTDQGIKSRPLSSGSKTPASNKPTSGFEDISVQSTSRAVLRVDDINKASKYSRKLFDCEKRLESAAKDIPAGPVSLSDPTYRRSISTFIKQIEEFRSILHSFIYSSTRRGLESEFRSIDRSYNMIYDGAKKAVKASAHYMKDDVRKQPYYTSLYEELMKDARQQIHEAVQYTLRGQGLQFIVQPVSFKDIVDATSANLQNKLSGNLSELVVESIKSGRLPPPKTVASQVAAGVRTGSHELISSLRSLPKNTVGHCLSLALERTNAQLIIGTPLGKLGQQYRRIERARSGAPVKELVDTTFSILLRKLLHRRTSNIVKLKLLRKRLLVEAEQGILINIALEILLPKLKEAFRPKGNLDYRLKISTGTLKQATDQLNSLGIVKGSANIRLSFVRDTCLDAIGTLNATRFLEKDVYRALGHKARLVEKYRKNLEMLPMSRWAPGICLKLGPPEGESWVIKAYDENMEIFKQNQDDELLMSTIDFIVAYKLLEHTIQRTKLRFMLEREEEFESASEILRTLPYIVKALKQLEQESAASRDKRVFFIIPPGHSLDGTYVYKRSFAKISLLPSLGYIIPTQEISLDEGRIRSRSGAVNFLKWALGKPYLHKYLVEMVVGEESRFLFEDIKRRLRIGTSEFRLKNGQYTVSVTFYCETGEKLYFEYPLVVRRDSKKGAESLKWERARGNKILSKFNEAVAKYNAGQTTREKVLARTVTAHNVLVDCLKGLSLYSADKGELKAAMKNILFFHPLAMEYISTYSHYPSIKDILYRLCRDTLSSLIEIGDEESYAQALAFLEKNKKYFYVRRNPRSKEWVFDWGTYARLGELAVSLGKIKKARSLFMKAKSLALSEGGSIPQALKVLPEDYRN